MIYDVFGLVQSAFESDKGISCYVAYLPEEGKLDARDRDHLIRDLQKIACEQPIELSWHFLFFRCVRLDFERLQESFEERCSLALIDGSSTSREDIGVHLDETMDEAREKFRSFAASEF